MDFGWGIAHGAVTRRPSISPYTMAPRTGGYAYDFGVWDLSIVQGPFSVAPCQTPNVAIRNLCIAVPSLNVPQSYCVDHECTHAHAAAGSPPWLRFSAKDPLSKSWEKVTSPKEL
jgi:hypothetical protein